MALLKSSRYLEEILFKEQSSTADQFFEKKSDQLFETATDNSFVEICAQELPCSEHKYGLEYNIRQVKDDSELSNIEFSCQGVSPPESPSPAESVKLILDRSPPGSPPRNPPRCIGENDLYLYTITDPLELSRVAAESPNGFRICFVRQRHPNSRLLMTRELFETLMATFDIFPRFRDFVVFFGFKQTEPGVGPPQMQFRAITTEYHSIESRKNIGFECAYELRYVEQSVHYLKKPWRLRQTAVYHRYRLDNRSSSWVVVSASSDAESGIDRYIKSEGDLTALCPFELHLLIVEHALSNWRPYIAHLTEDISEQV